MESSQFPSFWETSSVSPLSLLCLSSVSHLSLLDCCLVPACLSSTTVSRHSVSPRAHLVSSHTGPAHSVFVRMACVMVKSQVHTAI